MSDGVATRRTAPAPRSSKRFVLPALVAGYCVYAAGYIVESSFVLGGTRYFCLLDDAMISMRYARNLAEGFGLVWNPGGEAVEGYTNPFWVLVMTVPHLLGVDASKTSLFIQALGAALLAGNLVFVWLLAERVGDGKRAVAVTATALTALYLPLNYWGLMGMEVAILAPVLTASAWLAVGAIEQGRPPIAALALLAASTLVRMDMACAFLALLAFSLAVLPGRRVRLAASALALLVLFLGSQTILRLWYYGEVFPNTYYLKLEGFPLLKRVARGGTVFLSFVGGGTIAPLAVAVWPVVGRRTKPLVLLALLVAAQCLYSVYVGGDAWEQLGGANRYIGIAMPLALILLGVGAADLVERLGALATLRDRGRRLLLTACVVVAAFLLNDLQGVHNPRLPELLLLAPNPARVNNEMTVRQGVTLREATAPGATIAVVCAGATPYFAERPAVDLLGKCDREIAHLPMHFAGASDDLLSFYPGHLKWDYAYSIGELQPDVITQLWKSPEEAAPLLSESYVPIVLADTAMWARRDSPRVRWELTRGATSVLRTPAP